ncbi:MAG: hypothetical protein WKF73_19385 [Nocardioidaceae bacterium]
MLQRASRRGQTSLGHRLLHPPDVWHAVEHGMLEINVWHGSSANVAAGDQLLTFVHDTRSTWHLVTFRRGPDRGHP